MYKVLLFKIALSISLLWTPSVVHAGLELCNDTGSNMRAAIGYSGELGWSSQGWWQIGPGECVKARSGALSHRFYYVLVQAGGWEFHDDKIGFCVQDADFSIVGDDQCLSRGYSQANFAKVDTGPEASHSQFYLSNVVTPQLLGQASEAESDAQKATLVTGFFQGCRTEAGSKLEMCTLVSAGRKYLVYGDAGIAPQDMEQLKRMPLARRVELSGAARVVFDTTYELVPVSVKLMPISRFDRLVSRLQGNWVSADVADDGFNIFGVQRINTYAGVETSVEYISIEATCGPHGEEGPYLFAWDSMGGTGLCYRVQRISDNTLDLVYLPTGEQLKYQRSPLN